MDISFLSGDVVKRGDDDTVEGGIKDVVVPLTIWPSAIHKV